MSTELLRRKLDRAFDHLDASGNGKVERDDLLGLGALILVGFGESPTSAAGSKVLHGFESIWRALSAELDVDCEGAISPEEFRTGMTSVLSEDERFDTVFRPAAEAVAELYDTDGDGVVGPAELRGMLSAFGTSHDDADTALDLLDHDLERGISVGELVEATRAYYRGADQGTACDQSFGSL
ncbi:EF-hand domain-containing protein [Streptosporangium carneum]|uniref:Calcium-binding protein n=1 Tax=Streptosporangium carneum TaxID=47481 RepID=A0A9W6I1Z9_9ACTN|nr:EF-hand domain-containing protein [Streptosporangium carneum]GLK10218.1 calcium-binding protein [Streptosporangium carneum]